MEVVKDTFQDKKAIYVVYTVFFTPLGVTWIKDLGIVAYRTKILFIYLFLTGYKISKIYTFIYKNYTQ